MPCLQLFDIAGGGPETDAFKHLAAAFTVLRHNSPGGFSAQNLSRSFMYINKIPVIILKYNINIKAPLFNTVCPRSLDPSYIV